MPSEELTQEIEQAIDQVVTQKTEEAESEISEETKSDDSDVSAEQPEQTSGVEESTKDTEEVDGESKRDDDSAGETDTTGSEDEDVSAPDLSDEIIARAFGIGMSMTDVLSFPSEESLERVIDTAERMRATVERQFESEDTVVESQDDVLASLELDPEKYEPETIELFKKVSRVLKHQQEQLQSFRQAQEQSIQMAVQSNAREVEQWFDKQVTELGDDFVDTLGAGPYRSLGRGSTQFANREAIANQMAILLAGYTAQGLEAPPREKVFQTAAKVVLSDKFQELRDKQLTKNLAKRSEQHIQRVSGSKAKVKAGDYKEEIAALLDEKFGR